ncbi:MAG TPA: TolC family protein [Opitutaceae bacterium]|nr:TolC family protein [Opitutaceae bacterium]
MSAVAARAPAQEAGPTVNLEAGPLLTLNDAIRLALARNKNLKVVSFERGISRANLLAARGQFDPSIQAARSGSDTPEQNSPGLIQVGLIPLFDIRQDSYSVALAGQTPLGTTYQIGASATNERYSFYGYQNDYMAFGGFTVTQHLLKGLGFDANLAQVRIQKANRAISDCDYRQSAINTVTNVVIAYSNLQFAHDALAVARRTRELAASLLSDNEKNFKIGNISQADVIQARSQVAALEEPVLIYDRSVRDAENALRELIGEDTFFEDKPLFTLVPFTAPDVTVDRRADLARALQMRPDYQAARLGIVQYRATEAAARNGILPQVDFVGGYGYNGFGSTLSASRQMVEQHDNPSYSAGLQVTIPLTFAVGRGTLRAALLQREKAEADLRRFEADIAVAVATAEGQIETTRKRVIADEAAFALANQALAAEEKKKRAGASTTLAVEQVQQNLASVEFNVSSARASERQAVANFDQQLGTTLERYDIRLADE